MSVATPRAPGRPRSAEADRAILTAALDLVADEGVGSFCVEDVAVRAGVGKTTIYRRFPNKEALLAEALRSLNDDLPPPPDTGSVRTDLVIMLDRWREKYDCTHTGRLLPRMLSAARTHPELFATYDEQVVRPRRERFAVALRRGVARGEVRDDVDIDLVVTAVIGPMLLTMLAGGGAAVHVPTSEDMVDLLVRGVSP